jgi:hypothetical protein
MGQVRKGIVFFLRPHRELLKEDGVRAGVDWEEVLRIDGMVKMMLEMFAVPYIPISCLSMQERTRTVERVLGLAGLNPTQPRKRYLETVAPVPARGRSLSETMAGASYANLSGGPGTHTP